MMHLVEPRRHIGLSKELAREVPYFQHLADQKEAAGRLVGIWKDNGFYLIGDSRFDERPETVSFVMTEQDWQNRQRRKPLTEEAVRQGVLRAMRMYPALCIWLEL